MAQTRPKDDRQQMLQTSVGVDGTEKGVTPKAG